VCLAAVLVAVVPAACAKNTSPSPEDNGPQVDVRTRVRVVNQQFNDMTIFVVTASGQQIRLGLASGTSTSVFDIPPTLLAGGITTLQFLAVPIAGFRNPFTQQLNVQPGDEVDLTIVNQ
jgi:hypothetical protein